jgi:putative oxidoreductase
MKKSANMMAGIVTVLGRLLLCTVFLAAAAGYAAPEVNGLAQVIAFRATVAPAWVLLAVITVLLIASFSVVVGYKARFGAVALLAFLVLTTYMFHGFTFWNIVNAQARHDQVIYLVMNFSVMGAMLLVVANGAGQMSLDGKG